MNIAAHEKRAIELNDNAARQEFFNLYKDYRPSLVARLIAKCITGFGTALYGPTPSYTKFRAIEIIARIPYQSWEVFSYCAQTIFFADEDRALRLANVSDFARVAQDNETMHVVVISQLMRKHGDHRLWRSTLIPMLGAFVYWWASFFLYFVWRRASLEVNFLFESHAYEQYDLFLKENEDLLKERNIHCHFLEFYGREVENEYDFFRLVRNDELLHRNASIDKLEVHH